jgi:predicted metal-dependent HD superfamily phosphohydrolase
VSDDQARVRAAWDESRFGLGLGKDDAALDDLVARYREPWRHYHDLSHVAACLVVLEPWRSLSTRSAEVISALLFHDVVYVPMAKSNEAESAVLARRVLDGADPDATARIARAIEATRTHDAPADPDAALVLDVDMSILAAAPDVFDRYEAAVRAEHAAIDDASFARGRSAFVAACLAREVLFHVPALHAAWDGAARANLRRSLARWSSDRV